jgi:hypothetical protein
LSSRNPTEQKYLLEIAEQSEARHLEARGRIYSCDGKVNKKQKIDGARLLAYDKKTKKLTIRVDHTEILEFWIEIDVSQKQLMEFIEEQIAETDENEEENGDQSDDESSETEEGRE